MEQRHPLPYKTDASQRQEMVTAIPDSISCREVHSSDFGRIISPGTILSYVLTKQNNKQHIQMQANNSMLTCLLCLK